jgi:hypothetical protein
MQDGTTWFQELGKLTSPRQKEERIRREAEARRAPPRDGAPGRATSGRTPAAPRMTDSERKERMEAQSRAQAQAQREQRINTEAEVKMGSSLSSGGALPDEDSRTSPATAIGQQRDARISGDRGVEVADRAYQRAIVKPNKDKIDQEEVEAAAGQVFASKDQKATPFGSVDSNSLVPLKGIVVRGATRAVAATPGLTSSEAGRTISNMLASGMDLRPDGTIAPKNDPRAPGIRLDRQTIEDITRFRRGAPAPAAQPRPGAQGPAQPKTRDPAAAEIGAGFLRNRGIQTPPREPTAFSDMGM